MIWRNTDFQETNKLLNNSNNIHCKYNVIGEFWTTGIFRIKACLVHKEKDEEKAEEEEGEGEIE